MKFRKVPVVIEATQWFKNGDQPLDKHLVIKLPSGKVEEIEGEVVRYFRSPDTTGQLPCQHCSKPLHTHGWIDTLEGGHIVCPGDWIITGVKNEKYPCKPDVFALTYEPAE